MFDIGWSEMAVIALIALIVIGPKDLPSTMKTIAQWMRKARSLTREFQSGIDDMVREAELEDAKKALESTRSGNLQRTLSNAIDPDEEVGKEVRSVEQEARRQDSGDKAAKAGGGKSDSNAEKAAKAMPSANVAPPHSLGDKASGDTAKIEASENKPAEPSGAGAGSESSKKTA
jgi:sec-independent protein translocase protein TatB